MMHIVSLAFLILGLTGSNPVTETPLSNGDVKMVDFEGLQEYLDGFGNDKTLVINFWATWCVPCVKELPYFEAATQAYTRDEVEVILVSLDFPDELERRVIPFVEEKTLKSKVILLNDPDANSWIDKVSPKWSGAIPATV